MIQITTVRLHIIPIGFRACETSEIRTGKMFCPQDHKVVMIIILLSLL